MVLKGGRAMIGKGMIESIKQGVDLVALIQSRGISLKKNGRGYENCKSFSISIWGD